MNFIFSNNVPILYFSCNVNKTKTTTGIKLFKKKEKQTSIYFFLWCPLLDYHSLPIFTEIRFQENDILLSDRM